jgi:hypothetical protein
MLTGPTTGPTKVVASSCGKSVPRTNLKSESLGSGGPALESMDETRVEADSQSNTKPRDTSGGKSKGAAVPQDRTPSQCFDYLDPVEAHAKPQADGLPEYRSR